MSRFALGHARTMDIYLYALGKATGQEVENPCLTHSSGSSARSMNNELNTPDAVASPCPWRG
jgi:hypothetical protein